MSNKAGFYWHVHHRILLEWCYDPRGRIDYIKNKKPTNEIETRLKWMTPVKGKIPKAIVKTQKAYAKAGKAYAKVKEVYCKSLRDLKDEIEALHAKEHSDCPWNGETLVFPIE